MNYIYFIICLASLGCKSPQGVEERSENRNEFDDFITQIEKEFIYKSDKQDILDCIKDKYAQDIDTITKPYFKVLYYESILNEFYDSHISLNTNTDQSFRLRSPIYLIERNNKFYIKNIFFSQLETKVNANLINAEVEEFNGTEFQEAISQFPLKCVDKRNNIAKEWIANKIVSGKRNEPRILTLKLEEGNQFNINLDSLELKNNELLLDSKIVNNIGYIRINNTLGNTQLVSEFDKTIDKMMDTKALIFDLRNTPNGGNTGVAEPIMGRLINKERGYQICENSAKQYIKTVLPRKKYYKHPVYVLVGRWTGSMGEGIAIGLDGMNRATIVGTEMNRLAGGIKTIKLLNSNFGFLIPFEKMYHLNGELRETFLPKESVNQTNNSEDHHMNYVVEMIKSW